MGRGMLRGGIEREKASFNIPIKKSVYLKNVSIARFINTDDIRKYFAFFSLRSPASISFSKPLIGIYMMKGEIRQAKRKKQKLLYAKKRSNPRLFHLINVYHIKLKQHKKSRRLSPSGFLLSFNYAHQPISFSQFTSKPFHCAVCFSSGGNASALPCAPNGNTCNSLYTPSCASLAT